MASGFRQPWLPWRADTQVRRRWMLSGNSVVKNYVEVKFGSMSMVIPSNISSNQGPSCCYRIYAAVYDVGGRGSASGCGN